MANQDVNQTAASDQATSGVALCLSGGGYRAMVFHLGAFWRLNELGYLRKLDQVSAVSGGAVTAAVLGMRFDELGFGDDGVATRLRELVVDPVLEMTRHSLDTAAIIGGMLTPGSSANRLVEHYRLHLFDDKSMSDLADSPNFVFSTTNLQSGAVFEISKQEMRDLRVGTSRRPLLSLARAIAASSAVPPYFSPVHLELDSSDFVPGSGQELHCAPYTTDVVLSNGGFLDKLAVGTAWSRFDTILVADGGAPFRDDPEPKEDWVRHTQRILELVDRQERHQRKQELLESYKDGARRGAYWSLRTDIAHYQLADALPCPFEKTHELALMPSRLKRIEPTVQERLINWGYAVCDAAMRKHVDDKLAPPTEMPFPKAGIG